MRRACACLSADCGDARCATTGACRVGGSPAGRVLVNGKSVGEIGPVVLRDRQLLAEEGLVAVSVAVDRRGALLAGPEIASRGFGYVKENEPLLAGVNKAVPAGAAARGPDGPCAPGLGGAPVRPAVPRL